MRQLINEMEAQNCVRSHNSVWSMHSSTNFESSQRTRKLAGSEVVAQLWLVYYNEMMRVIATG